MTSNSRRTPRPFDVRSPTRQYCGDKWDRTPVESIMESSGGPGERRKKETLPIHSVDPSVVDGGVSHHSIRGLCQIVHGPHFLRDTPPLTEGHNETWGSS